MEYGKLTLGIGLLIIAAFFALAHNAEADMLHLSKWMFNYGPITYYIGAVAAALLGIFIILLELRHVKY